MELFDFLMVLDSIIIGLGIAEVLTGLGQLIRAKGRTAVYGVHAAVVALIFVSLVQHWWDSWGLRGISEMTFPGLLLFVAGPVLLFLLGYLAFPRNVAGADLADYYYAYSRPLWSLAALYLVSTILFRPLVLGAPFGSMQNLLRLGAVALCAGLAITHRRFWHAVGVGIAVVLLTVYITVFTLLNRM